MAQQIYYLIAYDVGSGKWMNADYVLSSLVEGPVFKADTLESPGEWSQLKEPELIDQDFDNTEVLTEFLRQANQ